MREEPGQRRGAAGERRDGAEQAERALQAVADAETPHAHLKPHTLKAD